jgi:hypothetical protein
VRPNRLPKQWSRVEESPQLAWPPLWLLRCAVNWAGHGGARRTPTALQKRLAGEMPATKLFMAWHLRPSLTASTGFSASSAMLCEVYHPEPLSFAAARFAFMASFFALPPRPAFSCCLVIFGSAHGKRVSDGTLRRAVGARRMPRCGAATVPVRVTPDGQAVRTLARGQGLLLLFVVRLLGHRARACGVELLVCARGTLE